MIASCVGTPAVNVCTTKAGLSWPPLQRYAPSAFCAPKPKHGPRLAKRWKLCRSARYHEVSGVNYLVPFNCRGGVA